RFSRDWSSDVCSSDLLVADAASATPEDMARIRRNALGEPAVMGRYLSDNAKAAQVIVTLNMEAGSTAALKEIADAAEQLRQETEIGRASWRERGERAV